MKRIIVFVYGVLTYVMFLGVFLYAVGFVGNMVVPKSIDGPVTDPLGQALLVNALLLGLFAVQHSIMARPWFKEKITKLIPAAAERSTFVLLTNLILILLFWQWRPVGGTLWQVENQVAVVLLNGLFWLGWGIVLVSTFLIDHFELFGLKQVSRYLRNKPWESPHFQEHSLYKVVRHPIMLGFVIAFWATPDMTMARLFFAGLTTAYILVGITFEERDLVNYFGDKYIDYAGRVPMLIPLMKLRRSGRPPEPEIEESS